MPKELPSPELLRKLLRYEPDTGKLYWLERTPDMFTDGKQSAEHNCIAWNSKLAFKEAFTARNSGGYMGGRIFGKTYKSHRVIWAIVYGNCPDCIDHINGIKSDNRIENLRSVSHAENSKNSKMPSNNTSGVCGVSWHKSKRKWRAQIKIDGKDVHLGFFVDKADAITTRKVAEVKYGFHKNHGRQI